VIKYLGSKRRLVPVIEDLLVRSGARTALDLFSGTTRVGRAFKARGARVTALDSTRYAEMLARCYIATDATQVDGDRLTAEVARLNALPGRPGYVTATFCQTARFFQPFNGERIDAVRDDLETRRDDPLFPVLVTSLLEAADRVDSTTGVQMAYLKQWSDRSHKALELRVPDLIDGPGEAVRGDALQMTGSLGSFDLAYLDPPYNQHRYLANYHVWETLVAWDDPEHYGIAQKRIECRDPTAASAFNAKASMPTALRQVVKEVKARVLVLSYNDESWMGLDDLVAACQIRGHVAVLGFDSTRYVGARIGIYDPSGRPVGTPGRLRNVEYLLVAGDEATVEHLVAPYAEARITVDRHQEGVTGGSTAQVGAGSSGRTAGA